MRFTHMFRNDGDDVIKTMGLRHNLSEVRSDVIETMKRHNMRWFVTQAESLWQMRCIAHNRQQTLRGCG